MARRLVAEKWVKADVAAKRQLLGFVRLNFSLDGATLVPDIRKPFDILAEGLSVSFSRGDSHCTFVNEISGLSLVLGLFPQTISFDGDAVLYSKRGKLAANPRLAI